MIIPESAIRNDLRLPTRPDEDDPILREDLSRIVGQLVQCVEPGAQSPFSVVRPYFTGSFAIRAVAISFGT